MRQRCLTANVWLNFAAVLAATNGAAHVRVISVPAELTAQTSDVIEVPILVDNADEVLGYFFSLQFDPEMLAFDSIENGTLTASWGPPTVNVASGLVIVAGAGVTVLHGAGTLVRIRLLVGETAVAGATCALDLKEVELNDGAIEATALDGKFTVGNGPQEVFVCDSPGQFWQDLTGETDFDPAEARNLTIYWNAPQVNATDWHVYVRKGLGGVKYLGHTMSGSATSLDWRPEASGLAKEFRSGPDFNSAYTFRVIRVDGDLSPDDYFNQVGWVGFNLEGGNPVSLSQPVMPNLEVRQICIYDDILGGNDLAPTGGIGSDTDDPNWRAIQIAWNFGVDPSTVNMYHVRVSVNGADFDYLGQTGSGDISYFWWTPDNEFRTAPNYADGPQGGKNYQFRVVLRPLSGLPEDSQTLTTGKIMYSVSDY